MRPVACALSLLALAATACTAESPECRIGADCPSGACRADGSCVEPSSSGANGSGAGGSSAVSGGGGSTSAGGAEVGAGGAGGCLPNGDGSIVEAEVPLGPGLGAKYRVALDATVSTAGAPDGDGRSWDYTAALPGDHTTLFETLPLEEQWFAATFPGASYAVRLSDEEDLLGVFEIAAEALLLRGVVSPTDGPGRTELVYDPPVAALRFPLAEDDTWQDETTVSGLALGVAAYYTESYASTVDAHGTVATPFAQLEVLRVSVLLERTVGLAVTEIRSQHYIAECFGPVASATAQAGESEVDFDEVAELRRLAP